VALPTTTTSQTILVVCTGNVMRSLVLAHFLRIADTAGRLKVDSAGTLATD
jgi:protein-tyrosine-phosphatase